MNSQINKFVHQPWLSVCTCVFSVYTHPAGSSTSSTVLVHAQREGGGDINKVGVAIKRRVDFHLSEKQQKQLLLP